MRKIWQRSEVDGSKEYVLLLFENEAGVRDFEICESGLIGDRIRDPQCVFHTGPVPMDLVLRGDVLSIAERVKLSNGESFYFNSDGIWFTQDEIDDLDNEKLPVRWVRGQSPMMPSR